jgi:integrase/recombinase XerD
VPDKYLWVLDEIRNLNPENKYVFVGKDGDFLSAGTVRNHLKRINKQLGIYQKSPHKIRKTYGTILLDNNVDKRFILTQMGHADILTTEQHYHRNRRSLDARQEIISKIPDL